jgi:hypothetical protein
LTAFNNRTDGLTGLPVITKGDNLTIVTANGTANPGYDDAIDAASHFWRVFDVASGGSLALENVTLQNGRVTSPFPGATQEGGAIFNQGSLVLSELMIQNNSAQGWRGTAQPAAGGGIWSDGTLTVENSTVFQGNSAFGGSGTYTTGGNAYGGRNLHRWRHRRH